MPEDTFHYEDGDVLYEETIDAATPEEAIEKLTSKGYPPKPSFEVKDCLMNLGSEGKTPRWYLPAKYRIAWFREIHPDAKMKSVEVEFSHERGEEVTVTELDEFGKKKYIKKFVAGYARYEVALIIPSTGGESIAVKDEWKHNFKDFATKAQTGAYARAIGFLGFGTTLSGDEMDEGFKKGRLADSPTEGRKKAAINNNNRQPAGMPPPPPPPPAVPPVAVVPAAPVVEEKPKLPPPPPPTTGGGAPKPAAPPTPVAASTPQPVAPPPPPPASIPKVAPVAAPPAIRPVPASAPPATKSVPARASAPPTLPNATNEPDEDSFFYLLAPYERDSLLTYIGLPENTKFPLTEDQEIQAIERSGEWEEWWKKQKSIKTQQDEVFHLASELKEVRNVKSFMHWNWFNGDDKKSSADLTIAQIQQFIDILKQVKLLYVFAIKAQGDPGLDILKQFVASPAIPEKLRNIFYLFRTNIPKDEVAQRDFNIKLYLHKLLASTDFSKLSPEELVQYHAMKAEVASSLHSADKAA